MSEHNELLELAQAARRAPAVARDPLGYVRDPLVAGMLLGIGWAVGSGLAAVLIWVLGAVLRGIIER